MRRRLATATVLALALTGVAACGGSDSDSEESSDSISGLTVTGDFGEEPKIEVDGLDVSAVETAVAIEGEGAEMSQESAALYRFVIANGGTGETVASNYQDNAPQQLVMSQENEVITESVEGKSIGSRVLLAMPVKELLGEQGAPQVGLGPDDDLVMVIDLIEEAEAPLTGPEGEEVEPPADAPKIIEEDGAITGLDFEGLSQDQPKKFEQIYLIKGEGDPVEEGDSISVNYIGTKWGTGNEPFDNSYERGEPASFSLTEGGLIDGWVKGLDGVKVGSRVMLVIPPELGYKEQGNPQIEVTGEDTLVFVIDVLGKGA
jgi:peptidylprolyl isomerase